MCDWTVGEKKCVEMFFPSLLLAPHSSSRSFSRKELHSVAFRPHTSLSFLLLFLPRVLVVAVDFTYNRSDKWPWYTSHDFFFFLLFSKFFKNVHGIWEKNKLQTPSHSFFSFFFSSTRTWLRDNLSCVLDVCGAIFFLHIQISVRYVLYGTNYSMTELSMGVTKFLNTRTGNEKKTWKYFWKIVKKVWRSQD